MSHTYVTKQHMAFVVPFCVAYLPTLGICSGTTYTITYGTQCFPLLFSCREMEISYLVYPSIEEVGTFLLNKPEGSIELRTSSIFMHLIIFKQ